LFVKLLKKKVSVSFVQLIRNWYQKLYASVLWNNTTENTFQLLCGIRQGGVVSPILFSIYVDNLINGLCQSEYSVYIGSTATRQHFRSYILRNRTVCCLDRLLCVHVDIEKSTVPLDGLHIRNNVLNVTRTNVDLGITVTDDLKLEPI